MGQFEVLQEDNKRGGDGRGLPRRVEVAHLADEAVLPGSEEADRPDRRRSVPEVDKDKGVVAMVAADVTAVENANSMGAMSGLVVVGGGGAGG